MNFSDDLEICHECGLDIIIPRLALKQKAVCPRCGYVLTIAHPNAHERILAFASSALIFLIASLFFEFLTFKSNGIERTISLLTSIEVLTELQYHVLAILALITIFIIPTIILLSVIYLLVFLKNGIYPKKAQYVMDLMFLLMPWSMVEIFLIGILVSFIKLVALADIELGLSFYAFILFSLSMLAALVHIDKRSFYHLLHLVAAQRKKQITPLHFNKLINKNHSVQHTWALIFTAVLLYIPANIFPIMNTRFLGQDEESTIIGGVLLLWQHGSYPIAIIIFVASILVPVSKIFVLAWLNYSVQINSSLLIKERMSLYRLAEFVGRWSMVDVFVVVILVSLVQLGDTMSVLPGYSTIAFSGVVIVTMLAAITFDSRLIYQNKSTYE